jgi:hypothetical protein
MVAVFDVPSKTWLDAQVIGMTIPPRSSHKVLPQGLVKNQSAACNHQLHASQFAAAQGMFAPTWFAWHSQVFKQHLQCLVSLTSDWCCGSDAGCCT